MQFAFSHITACRLALARTPLMADIRELYFFFFIQYRFRRITCIYVEQGQGILLVDNMIKKSDLEKLS